MSKVGININTKKLRDLQCYFFFVSTRVHVSKLVLTNFLHTFEALTLITRHYSDDEANGVAFANTISPPLHAFRLQRYSSSSMSLPKLECDRPRQVVNGNGTVAEGVNSLATYGERRLRLNPNMEHKPEKYDDVESDYGPIIFSMLERHLPPSMLDVPKDAKISFMKDILSRYLPEGERSRVIHSFFIIHSYMCLLLVTVVM